MGTVPDRQHAVKTNEGLRPLRTPAGDAFSALVIRVFRLNGLLEDEGLQPGDWVLIHVGFAMSKIDEAEAQMALQGLQLMGQAFTDEMDALMASRTADG